MSDPRFEPVLAEAESSFRCVHLRCDDFTADHAWHYHPQYELLWVIRSRGTRFVGDNIERYQPGDLVLSGPNLPHCYRNESSEDGTEAPEWIVVQFDPVCFGEGFLALPEAGFMHRLLNEAACGVSFGPGVAGQVGSLLRTMTVQSGMSRLLRLLEVLNILACAADRTRLAASDYLLTNQIDQTHLDRMEAVQRYIRENLAGVISQSQISDRLSLSASAFSRFFRAATGQTFMGLVKVLRVNEFCRLLSGGSARITDIALQCGYQHTSHFDQQFFEVKGMSPSEYRRRTRLRSQEALEVRPLSLA